MKYCPETLPLIHTGLQPGGKALTIIENRFNGFQAAKSSENR